LKTRPKQLLDFLSLSFPLPNSDRLKLGKDKHASLFRLERPTFPFRVDSSFFKLSSFIERFHFELLPMLLNFFSSSKLNKLKCLFLVSHFSFFQYLDKTRNIQGIDKRLVFNTNILFGWLRINTLAYLLGSLVQSKRQNIDMCQCY
jgi:hypothetical protein